MKKKYILISLSMLFCLFVYLFFRTEKTVITQLFISIITFDEFVKMRTHITASISLSQFVIYSLPEGLWVFCISLTSQSLIIKLGPRELSLLFAPLLISIGLELFQLLELTRGRFDVLDIGTSILFWAIGSFLLHDCSHRQNIFHPFTKRSALCVTSYLIVYLAHVWK